MKILKKKLEVLQASALGITLAPRVKIIALEAPSQRKAGIKVESIDELVQKLQAEARVL